MLEPTAVGQGRGLVPRIALNSCLNARASWLAARAAQRVVRTCARYSRIQQLYVPPIDASRTELSADVWVDMVLTSSVPSNSRCRPEMAKSGDLIPLLLLVTLYRLDLVEV